MLPSFETEHFYAQYEFSAPYPLSVSDCETLSIQELLELAGLSLENLGGLRLGYTESQGNPDLRQAIAATYEDVSADEVMVLATPIEGIYLTFRTLLEPGDEAVVLTPAYDALLNLPEHLGTVKPWALSVTDDGWALDFEALEALLTPKTKLIVINFPHNPTGFLPTEEDFRKLLELAQQRGIWVYSDEMYRGLEWGATPQLPSACERYGRSIVLSGLSKTHGLPGLRSGWLVVKDAELLEKLLNYKLYTSICPPAPVEYLAQVALSVQDKLITRNKQIVRENLELARPFFEKWSELFTWRPPLAGSVALAEVGVTSATEFCHILVQEAGVVLLPSAFMGFPDRFVRFGFGRKNFGVGLEAFDQYLAAMQSQSDEVEAG